MNVIEIAANIAGMLGMAVIAVMGLVMAASDEPEDNGPYKQELGDKMIKVFGGTIIAFVGGMGIFIFVLNIIDKGNTIKQLISIL